MLIPLIRSGKRSVCTAAKCNSLRRLIKLHTEVSREHLTPEIALHLITPSCELWTCKDQDKVPFSDPYWAFYWPGGQAVARYILDNPKTVRGCRVIDVGSGSGACAIAAAKAGAQSVTANDIDTVAGEAIFLNCSINHVKVNVSLHNIIGKTCSEWDIFLLGDVLYDTEFAERLHPWIESLKNSGKTILVGDPGRYTMNVIPKGNLQLLATYNLPPQTNLENRVAGEAIFLNCSINHVKVNVSLHNIIGKTCSEWDIFLLGDVLYDTEFAERLHPWIESLKNSGKTILVGDPGRYTMNVIPKGNLQLLATYNLPPQTNLENRGFSTAFVWKIL